MGDVSLLTKGYKGSSETSNTNGLFADQHPTWQKKLGIQSALQSTLKAGNPYLGVYGMPMSTSVGE